MSMLDFMCRHPLYGVLHINQLEPITLNIENNHLLLTQLVLCCLMLVKDLICLIKSIALKFTMPEVMVRMIVTKNMLTFSPFCAHPGLGQTVAV